MGSYVSRAARLAKPNTDQSSVKPRVIQTGLTPGALANYAANKQPAVTAPTATAPTATAPTATAPVTQQATIPTTTTPSATGLPGVSSATTNVPQTQKQGMQQQIPAYLLQELLMGARYNNPYMSGISGPYQMPQYAGLQNIAPWAMPQNPSMYGGGFGMPYSNNMQPSAPNMNNLLSAFLGAWR